VPGISEHVTLGQAGEMVREDQSLQDCGARNTARLEQIGFGRR
jgi:hypothetical protein